MKRSLACCFSVLPILAATIVLVTVPTGCAPIGCFPMEEAGDACPARADALEYFGDPDCGGEVASVDSEASLRNGEPDEGTLCCYAITNKTPEYNACPEF